MLRVQVPVRVGDGVRAEHAVLALLLLVLGHALVDLIAVDPAVDDAVGDVDALRAEVARHRLRDRAQPGLGRGEGGEGRPTADRRGCAGEDYGPAAVGQHAPRGLSPDQKAAQAAEPPDVLEEVGLHLEQVAPAVIARVVDDELQARCVRRAGGVEEAQDLALVRGVRRHRSGPSAGSFDRRGQGLDARLCAPSDVDVNPLAGDAAADGGAQSGIGAHADDDGLARLGHGSASSS